MLGYIIYNKIESIRNKWFIEQLISEFKKINIELKLLIEENIKFKKNDKVDFFYNNLILKTPKFVINRSKNYLISYFYETFGIRVFNNSSVNRISNNKLIAYMFVSSIGIDILDTKPYSNSIIKDLIYPVIIKSIDGKGGNEVFYISNEKELHNNLYKFDNNYVVQKVASSIGKDLRVYILGNRIYKAVLRTSNNGFKSNYCLGNKASIYDLNDYEKNIINNILNFIKFDYAGIDFLFDNGKIVFNEFEDPVGARMLYDLTDLNIAKDFANYVYASL